jgi:hypothetical protein
MKHVKDFQETQLSSFEENLTPNFMKVIQKVLSLLVAHGVTGGLTCFIDKSFSKEAW